MRKNGTNELVGENATKSQLALYRHHVINGTVPKTIPAWAKKKAIPKIRTFTKGVFYPAWTYKKEMKHIPAIIPDYPDISIISTAFYILDFDKLNHYLK